MESRLPDREVQVCHRLREIRILLKWGMPDFAEALGISRDRLASYEYARAPIRFWLARTLGLRFNINQRWLATGELPQKPYFDLDPDFQDEIDDERLFTDVYHNLLKDKINQRLDDIAFRLGYKKTETINPEHARRFTYPKLGSPFKDRAIELIDLQIQGCLLMLPRKMVGPYLNHMWEASANFFKVHEREIKEGKAAEDQEATVEAGEKIEESLSTSIDNPSAPTIIKPVSNPKDPVLELMDRLRRLINTRRGMQSLLAKELCVTRQAVSNWLGGISLPSAGTVLRLLHWVEEEEARQQKRPGSVTAQPGQATPKGNPADEPPTKSDHKSPKEYKKSRSKT